MSSESKQLKPEVDIAQMQALTRTIIEKHFPNEIAVVELQGEQIIRQVISGTAFKPAGSRKAEFQFSKETAETILVTVQIVQALFAFAKSIIAEYKGHAHANMDPKSLENILVEKGIKRTKAEQIASEYAQHAVNLISSKGE